MDKESRIEIRIAEGVKEEIQMVATSLGRSLSEHVSCLIAREIEHREEEIALEAQQFADDMKKWSDRRGRPVSELLERIKNLVQSPTPRRSAREIALELEQAGMKQADIARVLNQEGHTYSDGGQFTYQRVWHLLNPNGISERAKRLGQS